MAHYRCLKFWCPSSRRVQTGDTFCLYPKHCTTPTLSEHDLTILAAQDIIQCWDKTIKPETRHKIDHALVIQCMHNLLQPTLSKQKYLPHRHPTVAPTAHPTENSASPRVTPTLQPTSGPPRVAMPTAPIPREPPRVPANLTPPTTHSERPQHSYNTRANTWAKDTVPTSSKPATEPTPHVSQPITRSATAQRIALHSP